MAINPSAFSGRGGSPADFFAWVERSSGHRAYGYPDAWRTNACLPFKSPSTVGVVLHVYYADLLDEILIQLTSIPTAFDLIITNASGKPLTVGRGQLPNMVNSVVLDVANRGRDILPLVQVVNAGLLDPYDIVLKVHTKRSEWRDQHKLAGTGAEWRSRLLGSLLGDVDNVRVILSAFAASPNLGVVTADGSLLGPEYWGDNQSVTSTLLRRLELPLPRALVFAAGSMYWVRGFVLQGLRALGLSEVDFERETGQVNATTAHAIERLVGIVALEAGLRLLERSQVDQISGAGVGWRKFEAGHSLSPRIRAVPFYLPQFHPIPENDRWWGSGFTEWSNVAAARPVYPGHDQPKLPADLGFYDLRRTETVARQVELAQMAGIGGFMYYHYWFAGKQLLDTPIQDRVRGDLSLPFCLMWANENWTRRWDGRDSEILMGQRYTEVSAQRFIDDVVPILQDRRYMRVNSRPIVAVYRPAQIPDVAAVIGSWREKAVSAGVGDLYVIGVDVAKEFQGVEGDHASMGFDARLGFPPHNALWEWLRFETLGVAKGFSGRMLSYTAMADDAISRLHSGLPADYFPGVMAGFDNTARRQRNPDIWYGANPYTFRRWLSAAADAVMDREPDHRLVFINAWNEWAEGAVLEPTVRFGRTYLLAVRSVTLT
jgi:lipopolysaccharide biosynthesis protein